MSSTRASRLDRAESDTMPVKKRHGVSAEDDPRHAAVRRRDASADGTFVYSVKTTGVYCRPSCASRPARSENIAFHRTAADARRAGFRPCKRCMPDDPPAAERKAAQVTALCRFIEAHAELPGLRELARHAGLSPSHVHRLFTSVIGITPRAYGAAHRAKRVRGALVAKPTVTEAIFDAGYNSSGRFYERSNDLLGMTPTEYRAGGEALEIRFAIGACSLGSVLVAATTRGICAVLLGDDAETLVRDLEERFPRARRAAADRSFRRVVASVVALVEKPDRAANLPLDIRGTAFQQRVWSALRQIPPGQTRSYGEVARAIGSPRSVRAVARACAANAIAVAIPCHRVVRSDGTPSGYRWGGDRKRALLAREGHE